ncbi:protein FAM214B [Ursus americanus]|uniref:Atos homolog protein B n=2 Tax=Ursus TaxID=9639 RepID=A0A384CEU9_URSMA|nr:protein FAM214B [Ursus maritimus]XP_008693392.1 protein FAM214B [Ursus maritimus]XP_008693393.1 protein FAM214B [Ursus maritimus]XP_026362091.1 atos homolog protein B [Ursus arctos]XP_026362092.1 atos homolog protein B [Ursus arctos]XP_026362096.1 atos homolog protein B [Ursus arctos]XP_040487491.1 protein FAM214B [Ursus maritimus]XP_040487492.1 protein FAM214B [Ursus maritimus]XP_040487493.1 protein FAM214B [Ursus maritimus]XP_040487494.1 protein FAM214B [Ursus maritimus]XP_044242769.
MRHVQAEPSPSSEPEAGPSQPAVRQGALQGGLLMGYSPAGGATSPGVYQVSIFSPPAGASEPHRALKRPAPPTEVPRELKRGPGLGSREGLPPEEPSTVRLLGPEGLGLGLGVTSQHFCHHGLCVVEQGGSSTSPWTSGAQSPPCPPSNASCNSLHTRDWASPDPGGQGSLGDSPGPAPLGQLHTFDTDLHSLAQIGGKSPVAGVGNGGSPWPRESPGTANGHSPEHTPPGPGPPGPCPTKRRLLPAGEALDVSSEDEGPAPRRRRGTVGHPPAANSSDAKATPFWSHLLPGPKEPVLDPTDCSPMGRRLKGARRLKLSSLRSLRKGPGLLSPPSASPVPTPAVSRTLLGNFEESLLRGRFAPSGHIEGFTAEIGASGSYCPQHVTLPVTVTFFDVSEQNAPAPFLGVVDLNPLGRKGYSVPKVGTIQVTLFNPNQTVVKMFLVTFDFSDMPAAHMTFLRHRLFLVPVGEEGNASPTCRLLCYLLHLRFRSSRSGRLSLHGDIRLLFSRRSLELDTGLPYELQAVTESPHNPRYSPLP